MAKLDVSSATWQGAVGEQAYRRHTVTCVDPANSKAWEGARAVVHLDLSRSWGEWEVFWACQAAHRPPFSQRLTLRRIGGQDAGAHDPRLVAVACVYGGILMGHERSKDSWFGGSK